MRNGAGKLGPFTGRQLTTFFCVVTVMVLFPVGAWAVSASNTIITDAGTGKTAAVDANGRLQVKAVSGTPVKMQGSTSGNQAEVTKDQHLLVTEIPATSDYSNYENNETGSPFPLLSDVPTGDAVVVRSIQNSTYAATGGNAMVEYWVATDATCSVHVAEVDIVAVPDGTAQTPITFDPGLFVPAGDQLCGRVTHVQDFTLVTGYTLP